MSSTQQPTSLQPLPSLPLELKEAVLGFCDAPTLAVTSRVSLAFLEMSAPLLYRDVVVGSDRLASLFSSRGEDSQTSVEPWLSLDRIRSLAIVKQGADLAEETKFSLARSTSLRPVALAWFSFEPELCSTIRPLQALLYLLDPVQLWVEGPLVDWTILDATLTLPLTWTRLSDLWFVDGGSTVPMDVAGWLDSGSHLVQLQHHLSQCDADLEDEGAAQRWYASRSNWFVCVAADLGANWSSLSSVQITTENETDKIDLLNLNDIAELLESFGDKFVVSVAPAPSHPV